MTVITQVIDLTEIFIVILGQPEAAAESIVQMAVDGTDPVFPLSISFMIAKDPMDAQTRLAVQLPEWEVISVICIADILKALTSGDTGAAARLMH